MRPHLRPQNSHIQSKPYNRADFRPALPRCTSHAAARGLPVVSTPSGTDAMTSAMEHLGLASPLPSPPALLRAGDSFIRELSEIREGQPCSVDAVSLSQREVNRLVTGMGWDNAQVHRFLVACTRRIRPSVTFPEVAQHQLLQLLAHTRNHAAMTHMLETFIADPLTCAAFTAALDGHPSPQATPLRAPHAGPVTWGLCTLQRVHRVGHPALVVGEIDLGHPNEAHGLPPMRFYLGVPGALQPLILLRPPALHGVPGLTLVSGEVDQGPSSEPERTLLYVDTHLGQMFISLTDMQGGAIAHSRPEKGRASPRPSLFNTFFADMPEPLHSTPGLQAFRFLDGQVIPMTSMAVLPHYTRELAAWKRAAPQATPDDDVSVLDLSDGEI